MSVSEHFEEDSKKAESTTNLDVLNGAYIARLTDLGSDGVCLVRLQTSEPKSCAKGRACLIHIAGARDPGGFGSHHPILVKLLEDAVCAIHGDGRVAPTMVVALLWW